MSRTAPAASNVDVKAHLRLRKVPPAQPPVLGQLRRAFVIHRTAGHDVPTRRVADRKCRAREARAMLRVAEGVGAAPVPELDFLNANSASWLSHAAAGGACFFWALILYTFSCF